MSVTRGKDVNLTFVSTSLESGCRSVTFNIDGTIIDSTSATATAKAHIEGLYGWGMDAELIWDDGSGLNDELIYKTLLSGAQTLAVQPTGGDVGSSAPEYTGSAVVKSYVIQIPYDGLITSRVSWQGDGAISRSTS